MKAFIIRLLTMITGLIFFAAGIVLAIKANIGYAPWDIFHVGIANTTGLSIGLVSIFVGIILVIIVVILGEKLGIGTILNMVLIGLFIDILFPLVPAAFNPVIGTVMLVAGIFLLSIGTYFYIRPALGAGPRDSLMTVLARKTKFPVGLCRCVIEFSVTIAGWLLGGMVGFGTIIFVIAIGFCIQITFKVFKFDVTAIKHENLRETYMKFFQNPAGIEKQR